MAPAARMAMPWPEAATIEEATLAEQVVALGRELPDRPLVLGGCCCSHVGAVRELARRHGRIAVVWLDAHGDLNTPESSPSGNPWGMPLRMLIDGGDVDPRDVTLLGARNLDPPEVRFIAEAGIRQELTELRLGLPLYVAVDCDVIEPGELDVFMPEPDGIGLDDLEALLASLPRPIGAGITGATASARNEQALPRLGHALGL
jgi:arginase family enzyme